MVEKAVNIQYFMLKRSAKVLGCLNNMPFRLPSGFLKLQLVCEAVFIQEAESCSDTVQRKAVLHKIQCTCNYWAEKDLLARLLKYDLHLISVDNFRTLLS